MFRFIIPNLYYLHMIDTNTCNFVSNKHLEEREIFVNDVMKNF